MGRGERKVVEKWDGRLSAHAGACKSVLKTQTKIIDTKPRYSV